MKKFIFSILLTFVTHATYAQSKITSHIDMGTSVEWANSTMDGFYRYGEMNSTISASENTYRFYNSLMDAMKWTYTNKNGVTTTNIYNGGFADVPLDIAGNTEYDPATSLGNGWRLPTISEMLELVDNCKIDVSTDGKYFIFTSNVTGNIIVLPNVGYITYINETKSNMHIMIGQTATAEPRKWVSTLALNIVKGKIDYSVHNYVSLDKVTNLLPILPVYSGKARDTKDNATSYDPSTGDISSQNGATSVETTGGNYRRVMSYASANGTVSTSIPNIPGIYIVSYDNGDTEKIVIK